MTDCLKKSHMVFVGFSSFEIETYTAQVAVRPAVVATFVLINAPSAPAIAVPT